MIAQTLTFLVLVAAAAASPVDEKTPVTNKTPVDDKTPVDNATAVFRPFEGVDPNTLTCDPQGQIFLLLPHFTDCSKFYMCAHGEEVEFSCPGSLIFDFEIQACNWEWATTCLLRIVKEEEDIEGSGFDSGDDIIGMYGEEAENGLLAILTAESSGTVRPVSAVAATIFNNILNCNRADSATKQVPYKGDCQRYWKCVSGVPQVAYCTDGLFFNDSTQQCDFEANSLCSVDPVDELQGEFIVYE